MGDGVRQQGQRFSSTVLKVELVTVKAVRKKMRKKINRTENSFKDVCIMI